MPKPCLCTYCAILAYLLRHHGHLPKEVDTETLRAVLREPAEDVVQ